MQFTSVRYVNDSGYPVLVFEREGSETDGVAPEVWELPLEAVGNRAELYGLESFEHALEYLGKELSDSAAADEAIGMVLPAYNTVVNAEFAQTLMPHPSIDDSSERQTALNRMSISSTKRDSLTQARSDALDRMGVHKPAVEGAQLRTMSTQNARSLAAEAMDASDEVVDEACRILSEHSQELEVWRLETPYNACPQLREMAEAMADQQKKAQSVHEAGRLAGLKGSFSRT